MEGREIASVYKIKLAKADRDGDMAIKEYFIIKGEFSQRFS
jgi:hypothetical protein